MMGQRRADPFATFNRKNSRVKQAEINTTLKVLKINMRLAETVCYVLFNLVKSPLFYSTYSTDLSSRNNHHGTNEIISSAAQLQEKW